MSLRAVTADPSRVAKRTTTTRTRGRPGCAQNWRSDMARYKGKITEKGHRKGVPNKYKGKRNP